MRISTHALLPVFLASISTLAVSASPQLTTRIPECRMPSSTVLPGKYYKLNKSRNAFDWVHKATANERVVSGNGWERPDSRNMSNWYGFYRVDLNNDGICDWYLNALSPISTGGDRDTINTLYIGGPTGWARIGADIPMDKPDALSFGKAFDQQWRFTFGEEPSVIHDMTTKTNYVITALYNRHVRRAFQPGYRIYEWDAGKKTLILLDKWEPGSKAAAVYAFFKANGARMLEEPTMADSDTISTFDPQIEAYELMRSCDPKGSQRTSPDLFGAVSKYLLTRCTP
ncbi:hypothetical protein GCM10007386_26730 [Pseudoduganella dura]|nr:hypothetical protein GCM10007386_26730 [Pseudoduganella dura]